MNELKDFGLPTDAPKEAKDLVNFAMERLVDVMAERVAGQLASSVLRGSAMVIELLCRRVSAGEESLADAVREVSRRLEATRALPAPKRTPEAVDAEYRPVERPPIPATTPVDPPPPRKQEVAAALYAMSSEAAERRASAANPAPLLTPRPIAEVLREQRERAVSWNRT